MEKQQTALMRAIQRAKDGHNYYVDESLKDEYTEREQELLYVKSIALAEFIDTLAELLPVEKEQMGDNYTAGAANNKKEFQYIYDIEAEVYYNENYGDENK